jgi:enoyl-CoA hydratase/carnithine racemase
MVNDLCSALKIWTTSDAVKAIILRGNSIPSGKKSFCAGGDVVRTIAAYLEV